MISGFLVTVVFIVSLPFKGFAQIEVIPDNDDVSLFLQTEAKLNLGESNWFIIPSIIAIAEDNVSQYGGTIPALEVGYRTDKIGAFSIHENYISIPKGLSGNALQLKWQLVFGQYRLNPLFRLTAEQIYLEDIATDQKVLLNYRTRIRVGMAPELNDKWMLFFMNEWFPTQQAGFSKENRVLSGFQYKLNPSVSIKGVVLNRWRDETVSSIKWQHVFFIGLTYNGKISSKN